MTELEAFTDLSKCPENNGDFSRWEKDADNIRKILCKSLILRIKFVLLQVPSRLFWFAPVILLFLLK